MAEPSRADLERALAGARAELVRLWPSDKPQMSMRDAPSKAAREALQRVIRLQNEIDALDG